MKSSPTPRNGDIPTLAGSAQGALERVCSGAGLDSASKYYSPQFVDHVNGMEFRGLEGARRSVEMYKSVLEEIRIRVQEQIVEGSRVVSRFVVEGTNRGRRVRFNGITISRFEDGLIVEDWSVTDTLGLLQQLGPWRAALVALKQLRAFVSGRGSP